MAVKTYGSVRDAYSIRITRCYYAIDDEIQVTIVLWFFHKSFRTFREINDKNILKSIILKNTVVFSKQKKGLRL